MIETICKDCGARYQLGTDHVCKRSAKNPVGRKLSVSTPPAKRIELEDRASGVGQATGTKSTAALKEVRGGQLEQAAQPTGQSAKRSPIERLPDNGERAQITVAAAGTQAPPVDTHKRGRPRIHPDRRAYKAEHERKRRANKKAAEAAK